MRQTFLESNEDLKWLFDVHAKGLSPQEKQRTKVAILFGNEDAPERIELYERNDYRESAFLSIEP